MLIRSCTGRREGEVCSMLCDDPQAEGRRQLLLLSESSYMYFCRTELFSELVVLCLQECSKFPGSLDIFALSKFH